jgi:hypothetical protein
MTAANKKAFEKWYSIENLKEFNFKKEFDIVEVMFNY